MIRFQLSIRTPKESIIMRVPATGHGMQLISLPANYFYAAQPE